MIKRTVHVQDESGKASGTGFFQAVIVYEDHTRMFHKELIVLHSDMIFRNDADAQQHGFELVETNGIASNKKFKNIQVGVRPLILGQMSYENEDI